MKLKINAIRRKEMPSSFGGKPWSITSVKFDGVENPPYGYDLNGFGNKADKLVVGDTVTGYMSTKTYQKKDGSMGSNNIFNAISAEYVYNLVLKMNPEIENIKAAQVAPKTQDEIVDQVEEINPDDIPF